jgi:hypothetical protein
VFWVVFRSMCVGVGEVSGWVVALVLEMKIFCYCGGNVCCGGVVVWCVDGTGRAFLVGFGWFVGT